jgi:hypothetical protein
VPERDRKSSDGLRQRIEWTHVLPTMAILASLAIPRGAAVEDA